MKISEILTDRSKWTKGAYARDDCGDPVTIYDSSAVRFCLSGAATKTRVLGKFYKWFCKQRLKLGLTKNLGKSWEIIVVWNDDKRRTFPQVRRLVRAFERSLR